MGRTAERYTFHGHEHVGMRMAAAIGERLKLSNEERDRIEWLVDRHQILADSRQMRPAKLKRLLVHKGIHELFALHRADARASERSLDPVQYAEEMRRRWEADGTLDPPFLVTGDDLIAGGMKPGPVFKELLERVREAQLDGAIQSKDEGLALVGRILAEKTP